MTRTLTVDKLKRAINCLHATISALHDTGFDIMQKQLKDKITILEDEVNYIRKIGKDAE